MGHKILPAEKIKEVWDLDSYGAKADEIREKTGCQNPYQVIKNLKKTISRVNDGNTKGLKKTYIEAAKNIIEDQRKNQLEKPAPAITAIEAPLAPHPMQSTVGQERYAKFTDALHKFEDAIADLIYQEVSAQTSKINEENRIMREALEQAKIPNIVTNLQKKFHG